MSTKSAKPLDFSNHNLTIGPYGSRGYIMSLASTDAVGSVIPLRRADAHPDGYPSGQTGAFVLPSGRFIHWLEPYGSYRWCEPHGSHRWPHTKTLQEKSWRDFGSLIRAGVESLRVSPFFRHPALWQEKKCRTHPCLNVEGIILFDYIIFQQPPTAYAIARRRW